MRTPLISIAALAAAMAGVSSAAAQRAAEQFIPIGQSPGVSGVTSVTGTVESFDERTGRLTVVDGENSWDVHCVEGTEVYIDRSGQGMAGVLGSAGDITEGARVEVNFGREETSPVDEVQPAGAYAAAPGVATWIKVAARG